MGNQNKQFGIHHTNVTGPVTTECCSGNNIFEIRVNGQLDDCWAEWFDGLDMKLLENGEMALIGAIHDQAALMGVLNKLSRLNLALISVNQVTKKDQLEEK